MDCARWRNLSKEWYVDDFVDLLSSNLYCILLIATSIEVSIIKSAVGLCSLT